MSPEMALGSYIKDVRANELFGISLCLTSLRLT
jgi:hypothetical protein